LSRRWAPGAFVVATLIALAAGAAARLEAAAAAPAADAAPGGFVAASRLSNPPDYATSFESSSAVAGYWTPARMRTARPIEERLGLPTRAAGPTPEAARVRGDKYLQPPYRQFGRVMVRLDGVDYYCSATVVLSGPQDLVSTAAHCVYDNETGRFFDKLAFVPAYRNGAAPYGVFAAVDAFVTAATHASRRPNLSVDYAFFETALPVEQSVGGHELAVDQIPEQKYKAFGFPADRPFNGQRLWKCKSGLVRRDDRAAGPGPAPLVIVCDMTAGSSGGGWIVDVNAFKVGRLVSLVSYGFRGAPELTGGPYFDGRVAELYLFASAFSSS
jgi:hypothetical protein